MTFIVILVELRNLADLWIAVKTIFGGAVVVVTMDYCNLLCCTLLERFLVVRGLSRVFCPSCVAKDGGLMTSSCVLERLGMVDVDLA